MHLFKYRRRWQSVSCMHFCIKKDRFSLSSLVIHVLILVQAKELELFELLINIHTSCIKEVFSAQNINRMNDGWI